VLNGQLLWCGEAFSDCIEQLLAYLELSACPVDPVNAVMGDRNPGF
jgi:hypothetical protein